MLPWSQTESENRSGQQIDQGVLTFAISSLHRSKSKVSVLAVDGLSGHDNKLNLEFNLAFYMIPGISRDSRDYVPQISLPFP